jgi:hypothetical protein
LEKETDPMSHQPYLSDDMAPPHNKDVERCLDEWNEAKDEQHRAGEAVKVKHAALILQLQTLGIDAYPYTDPASGKKKLLIVAREPKAKITKPHKRGKKIADAQIGDELSAPEKTLAKAEKKAKVEASRVESRRVKRTAEHDAAADPFAGTRAGKARKGLLEEAEQS